MLESKYYRSFRMVFSFLCAIVENIFRYMEDGKLMK